MNIKYDECMHNAYAGKMYGCVDSTYEGVNWFEEVEPKPTKEELEAVWETIKSAVSLRNTHTERSLAYPSVGDQMDALFHAGVFPVEMQQQIQAVKDAHPKP
jgi:hypothetical protein